MLFLQPKGNLGPQRQVLFLLHTQTHCQCNFRNDCSHFLPPARPPYNLGRMLLSFVCGPRLHTVRRTACCSFQKPSLLVQMTVSKWARHCPAERACCRLLAKEIVSGKACCCCLHALLLGRLLVTKVLALLGRSFGFDTGIANDCKPFYRPRWQA